MANLNQLANGLTWFQCKGVMEIIGEKKLTNGSQFAKFANFSPLQYFPMHGILDISLDMRILLLNVATVDYLQCNRHVCCLSLGLPA